MPLKVWIDESIMSIEEFFQAHCKKHNPYFKLLGPVKLTTAMNKGVKFAQVSMMGGERLYPFDMRKIGIDKYWFKFTNSIDQDTDESWFQMTFDQCVQNFAGFEGFYRVVCEKHSASKFIEKSTETGPSEKYVGNPIFGSWA